MKKLLYLPVLVGIVLVSILLNSTLAESIGVSNTTSGTVITGTAYSKTVLVNQDPTTAEPGGYVELLFKIENRGTKNAENVVVEILPEYPFSLDPGINATNELGTIRGLQSGDNAFLLRYKLKVDKDAVEGNNEIKLKYSEGSGADRYIYIQTFNVSVSNPRTDFDAVVQDLTANSTTLAIVNIGANTAYSVIVKIPEQENFRVTGVSANVVGNLDAGEYTLASFQITPRGNVSVVSEKNLNVEISYTDTLGIRRTIQKEVRLDISGIIGARTRTQPTQSGQLLIGSGLMYIIIGVVGIIGVVAFFKFRKGKKK